MLDSWLPIICSYAHDAHWIIFFLLMLAGLNLPISEDILLLTGGFLAGTCIPESRYYLFAWIFAGCWISAWEAYWIGRLIGPKLYQYRWFSYILTPARVDRLHQYYEKFGIFTFIVGRFIPGGVRNALFMTSGLGKMPFLTFIARDGVACLISSATLFSIGYAFGENYQQVIHALKTYNILMLILALLIACLFLCRFLFFKRSQV